MRRDRWPDVPDDIAIAIGRAVERAGGDLADAHDLLDTWQRLHADKRGRLARLRYDAAHQPPLPTPEGERA